jgi:hypothetical protein
MMKLGTFLQPGYSMPHWASLGFDTAFRYETQGNTVSVAAWRAACANAGMGYISQASSDLAADAKDPNLTGWLHEQDEPDDRIVNRQDANDPAGEEAVYVKLETDYKRFKAAAPNIPVWLTISFWQTFWARPKPVNYKRIFAACDAVAGDIYFVSLGMTINDYVGRLNWLKSAAPGKILASFTNCSFINDNPQYHPKDRLPSTDEVAAQLDADKSMGFASVAFPQAFNVPPDNHFDYDGTTPPIQAVFKAHSAKATPAPKPAKGKYDGFTLTDPADGSSYTLTSK